MLCKSIFSFMALRSSSSVGMALAADNLLRPTVKTVKPHPTQTVHTPKEIRGEVFPIQPPTAAPSEAKEPSTVHSHPRDAIALPLDRTASIISM